MYVFEVGFYCYGYFGKAARSSSNEAMCVHYVFGIGKN